MSHFRFLEHQKFSNQLAKGFRCPDSLATLCKS